MKKDSMRAVLIGLALACIPLPLVLNSGFIPFRQSVEDQVFFNGVIVGIPALFLLLGYRQAMKTRQFARATFVKASAVIGIAIGLLVVIPLTVPLIYLRPEGVPSHVPGSQLLGILSLTTGWSMLCASIFWGVAISPMIRSSSPETS